MASPQPAPADEKSTTEVVSDLFELLKNYAQQETIDPIRSLGRFVGYGSAAALVLGIAGTLLTVGVLRLVQVETRDLLDGNWSWVPYMAALVVCGLLTVVSLKLIRRKPASERS
ncbi:MAG: hypothetical protein JO291_05125 [Acidimicrobiia bacterium]|nr:hypothetical protein [Acidimicrobiia bacterium]